MGIDSTASTKQILGFIRGFADIDDMSADRVIEIIDYNHNKALEFLLKRGYNISREDNRIFIAAMKTGNFEAIKILMDIKSIYTDDKNIIFSLQAAISVMQSYKKKEKAQAKIIRYVMKKSPEAQEKFSNNSRYGFLYDVSKELLNLKKIGKYADLL